MFWGDCAIIKWNPADKIPVSLVFAHHAVPRSPLSKWNGPVSSSLSQGLIQQQTMGGVRGWRSCDHDLCDFLPSDTCVIYLTCDPEGHTSVFCFSGTYPQFTIHSLFDLGRISSLACLSLLIHLLESNYCVCLLAACLPQAFVSKLRHVRAICHLSNLRTTSRLLKGKGRLKLSFVFRGKNDMPFIVQINDQISTSVKPNETNSS